MIKTRTFAGLCAGICLGIILGAALWLYPAQARSAEPGVTEQVSAAAEKAKEKVEATAEQAKASVQEAGAAAANKIEEIWKRIDESRLKNRTRDEIVAWIIMGTLVGAVGGLFTVLRTTAMQRLGMVALGLLGAFLAGVATHVLKLDFGMGPVLIRYEDLILSLAGGLFLIGLSRVVMARRSKKI